MVYSVLEKEKRCFPKGQTLSNQGTQSLWIRTISQDSQVAEENKRILDPKVMPLGFFIGSKKMRELRAYEEESAYYLTARASGDELLFRDDGDFQTFLEILRERKQKYNFKIYAYCLLANHYHLLIEPNPKVTISKIMQALNTSYSLYFNKKYNRSGHLLSGRFESKIISKDNSLLEQTIYLHLNLLGLGQVTKLEDYKWSSYPQYINTESPTIIDKNYIFSFLDAADKENKYKELIEVRAKEVNIVIKETTKDTANDTVVLATAQEFMTKHKFNLRPVGAMVIAAVLLSSLILSPVFLQKKLKPQNLSSAVAEENFVKLPGGLPSYSASNTQKDIQAWEVWKLGPVKQGESDVLVQ